MKKRKDKSIETDSWWQGHAKTDPQGSWTGKPADPMETPVQDADDLRRAALRKERVHMEAL